MRYSLWLIFFAGAAGLLGGFAGGYHPLGDSLAVFRLYALLALAVALLGFALSRRRFAAALSVSLLLFGGFSLRHQLMPSPPVEGFTLLQSNTRFSNDARLLVDFAKVNAPDIITLQEITTRSIPQLAQLRGLYPYQVICPYSGVGGVAILSKFRFLQPQGQGCLEGRGMVSAQIDVPFGALTVVSLHLYWPWPHSQAKQLANLLPELEALEGPVIVAGDFNMVPWATTISQTEAATDTRVVSGLRFSKSLFSGMVQLPIDQVLVPNGWPASATLAPQLGSDHNAILAQFVPIISTE